MMTMIWLTFMLLTLKNVASDKLTKKSVKEEGGVKYYPYDVQLSFCDAEEYCEDHHDDGSLASFISQDDFNNIINAIPSFMTLGTLSMEEVLSSPCQKWREDPIAVISGADTE